MRKLYFPRIVQPDTNRMARNGTLSPLCYRTVKLSLAQKIVSTNFVEMFLLSKGVFLQEE